MAGDQVYCHPSLRYYSSNVDRVKFLTANVEEDIFRMGEELKMVKSDIAKNRQNQQTLKTEIHKNENEARKTDTQLMKITQKIRKMTSVSVTTYSVLCWQCKNGNKNFSHEFSNN